LDRPYKKLAICGIAVNKIIKYLVSNTN